MSTSLPVFRFALTLGGQRVSWDATALALGRGTRLARGRLSMIPPPYSPPIPITSGWATGQEAKLGSAQPRECYAGGRSLLRESLTPFQRGGGVNELCDRLTGLLGDFLHKRLLCRPETSFSRRGRPRFLRGRFLHRHSAATASSRARMSCVSAV